MIGQVAQRILIVEDSNLFRRSLLGALVAAGYVVRTAQDGLDAIGQLRAGVPDLIISDLGMPRMSGYEFLAVVRQRFPQIPVIAMSAEISFFGTPKGVPADAFLHKSRLRPAKLLKLVSGLLTSPPARPAAPRPGSEPAQAHWDGDGHYIVPCGQCMRSFQVSCESVLTRGPQQATCGHCHGVASFLP
jgi:CheY-like chemotaxis protein